MPTIRCAGQGGGEPHDPGPGLRHLDAAQQSLTRTLENTVPRAVRLARTLTEAQVAMFMKDRLTRQAERERSLPTSPGRRCSRSFATR